ncbi:FecCD family ABC transporter permease [Patulibacter sp. S7RM1-6]
MTAAPTSTPRAAAPPTVTAEDVDRVARRRPVPVLAIGLLVALLVLALVCLLSVGVGSKPIGLGRVWELLWHPDDSDDAIVVHDLRIPRTVLGLLVGAALGVAGAVMQALTRNPLADPGILGVNAGASAAVVAGMAILGSAGPLTLVWFAFAGAALSSVLVYGLGASGRSGATPVRLALAGTAVSFALLAFVQGMTVLLPRVFDQYRFWAVGALAGHPSSLNLQIAPFVVAGLLLALGLARPLNALALGDDLGRALGVGVGRTRALSGLAVTLLCGASTAAVGPIGFVGLTVPHVARAITGPDQRWVLPYTLVLSPTLLLGADVLGRVLGRPGELQVAVVTAFLGAPVFIAIVRRRRIARL